MASLVRAAWLFLLCQVISCVDIDWDVDIVSNEETDKEALNDSLHQYFGEDLNDSMLFPTREDMLKLVGPFKDVDPKELKSHDYDAMTAWLQRLAKEFPTITHSVQGRELWVLVISDNPEQHEVLEPECAYVGNMHGNEVVSRETLLYLAEILCFNYGTNSYLTNLVDSTRIHLLLSMNPDGYSYAKKGETSGSTGRFNANGIDLNRNFPPKYPNHNDFIGGKSPQPETRAVMNWLKSEFLVLSGNLHGGSLLASYPFNDNEKSTSGAASTTKDDKLFNVLAFKYARAHPFMWKTGRRCSPSYTGETILNGVTNGAEWYTISGAMPDWVFENTDGFEITIEMGCRKFPQDDVIATMWKEHQFALLGYISAVNSGVKGVISDSEGNPIANATISVQTGKDVHSGKDGDYFRLLPPGNHQISITAMNFENFNFNLEIRKGDAVYVHNITLQRENS